MASYSNGDNAECSVVTKSPMKKLSVSPTAQEGRQNVTVRLCLSVLGAVLGSFQFGYNTGVINAPESSIKSFMNQTEWERSGESMTEEKGTNLFALIVAIFAAGGCLGGLAAGWWADFFGRKVGLLTNTTFGIVAAVLMYFSRLAGAYEMIIVGRFLVGINCGLYTGLTPLYLSEIASSDIRGALGVLHQLGVVLGILLSQVLGFQELLGNASSWEVLMGLPVLPCLLQLLILPFCPESPRFLLITKQRETQAVEALKSLRGTADVKDDIEEMRKEARTQEREEKVTLLRLFQRRSFRMPLIISVMMQLSQQLSGICGIFYYSSKLFKWAGLSEETATHATSGVGGVMVVMTVITIPLMDRAGRRSLHLIGLGGMFVFSIFITVSLVLRDKVEWFNGLSIAVSLIYVAFFALGPGSIPWLIVAELFSQGARPAAMSVAVLVNWVANFIVGYSFPHMQNGLGDYAFLPFTGLLLVFWAFTFWFVPETKGKTFEEVTALWQEGGQRDSNSGSPKEHSHLVP